jgi:hypothetical protein
MRAISEKYISENGRIFRREPEESVYGNDDSLKFFTKPPLPLWWDNVANKIIELLRLEPDWDTYGADSIDKHNAISSIYKLRKIIDFSAISPSVIPVSNGSIQYEWHTLDFDLEIVFSTEEPHYLYYYDIRNDKDLKLSISSDNDELKNILKQIPVITNG